MNHLYQYSTMGALVGGMFEGTFKIGDILHSGDYGIGTLDGLNGELIILEGKPYLIDSEGTVREVANDETTPFASVIQFNATHTLNYDKKMNKEQLDEIILNEIKGMNYFHAVKITGKFKLIKARSVKKQQEPYPKLVEAVKEQGYFDFEDTTGTLFGFYTPHFIQGIGVGGYHVHYLSDNHEQGGHVFDFEIEDVKVEMALAEDLILKMPDTEHYRENDLNDPDMLKDIEASE
ncbi:acetolactate decarboxylase [Macrococcoides canis]|uniref:Alpha-acetolactate decarboxylase n=1 Tax=Macrococcoides canis TaxID=1855823 RepID=A0A1W7A7T2_9STAP|nr:acetolactate decarboxylase [Macrococcus canis]ARQ05687.1 Alpha-acetolactate decarboxylase [Macrococcus canis]UTH11551.1 acetolactate decarboxylase [Macrococcus canis]